MEQYLTDTIRRPKYYTERLYNANLLPGAKPKAKPAQRPKVDSLPKIEVKPVEQITPTLTTQND